MSNGPFYFDNIPNEFREEHLRLLLSSFSLPTHGTCTDLRIRLQLEYLSWKNPSPEAMINLSSFFAANVTKKKLLGELDRRGIRGLPGHKIEDLQRSLTLCEYLKSSSKSKSNKLKEKNSGESNAKSDDESIRRKQERRPRKEHRLSSTTEIELSLHNLSLIGGGSTDLVDIEDTEKRILREELENKRTV